jgi:hypothetical protein
MNEFVETCAYCFLVYIPSRETQRWNNEHYLTITLSVSQVASSVLHSCDEVGTHTIKRDFFIRSLMLKPFARGKHLRSMLRASLFRGRIINMRAQHVTFNKAIKTVLKDCKGILIVTFRL